MKFSSVEEWKGMKLSTCKVEQWRRDETFQCGTKKDGCNFPMRSNEGDEASGRNEKCQEGITQRMSRDDK
jgi:hypothetical protein